MSAAAISIRRTGRRVAVTLGSRILYGGSRSAPAMIVNLSVYGCRAQCDIAFRRGDNVYLDLPGAGLVRVRIAWSRDGYFGALFLDPVAIGGLTLGEDEDAKVSAESAMCQRATR